MLVNEFKEMYSEAELNLIEALDKSWLDVISKTSVNPPNLFNILAVQMFCENRKGPEIDALRKVVIACRECRPYRETPEFDKLCEF